MKVAIVTPTIGTKHLDQCLQSVQKQTYENLTHYVFLDGIEHHEKIHPLLDKNSGKRKIKTISLEDNVGKGWCGHRVYAACSFLVNADVICYLDEDNWFEENHVETLLKELEKGNDWSFSLRKIVSKDGEFVCEDNCESLGLWPAFNQENLYHVDTSCFAVRKDVAVKIGHSWYDEKNKMSADRTFFHCLKHYFQKYSCTKDYTLNYRLGGDQGVSQKFFEIGNEIYSKKYNSNFPWKNK